MLLGHSDATLTPAIIKTGDVDDISKEIWMIRTLGARVCPEILSSWLNSSGTASYVMRRLSENRDRFMLVRARDLLWRRVWCRSTPEDMHLPWIDDFEDRFRMTPPCSVVDEKLCMTHGDPTLANTMVGSRGETLLIDPKCPGNGIPSMRSVDTGKMLQSMMGWEEALGGYPVIVQHSPFAGMGDNDLRCTVFWAMVHFLRICQREGDSPLGKWSQNAAIALEEYSA